MKIFIGFNQVGDPCPICKKHDNKKTVLIPIYGTSDGKYCEAKQVHLDCIDLTYYESEIPHGQDVIAMVIDNTGK